MAIGAAGKAGYGQGQHGIAFADELRCAAFCAGIPLQAEHRAVPLPKLGVAALAWCQGRQPARPRRRQVNGEGQFAVQLVHGEGPIRDVAQGPAQYALIAAVVVQQQIQLLIISTYGQRFPARRQILLPVQRQGAGVDEVDAAALLDKCWRARVARGRLRA